MIGKILVVFLFFQIENKKIELNVQSKVGSLDNVKHRPGGGDKKIFDDKDYLKQKTSTLNSENQSLSGSQVSFHQKPNTYISFTLFPTLFLSSELYCNWNVNSNPRLLAFQLLQSSILLISGPCLSLYILLKFISRFYLHIISFPLVYKVSFSFFIYLHV